MTYDAKEIVINGILPHLRNLREQIECAQTVQEWVKERGLKDSIRVQNLANFIRTLSYVNQVMFLSNLRLSVLEQLAKIPRPIAPNKRPKLLPEVMSDKVKQTYLYHFCYPNTISTDKKPFAWFIRRNKALFGDDFMYD
jgi:hypothetical protein